MYQYPKLKTGCALAESERGVRIRLAKQEIILEVDMPEKRTAVLDFIGRLDGNIQNADIPFAAFGLSPDEAARIIDLLDGEYMITEGCPSALTGVSGAQFAAELETLYHLTWLPEAGDTEFARILASGGASRNVIAGWTFEYYHVTRRAHDSIAPVLLTTHGSIRERLTRYFREEYRHDKLLMQSLHGLGFSTADVEDSFPLAYTGALMDLLTKWARTDALSFMSGLFIFEGTQQSGDKYISDLRQYDLPAVFIEGQLQHHHINSSENHGNVTRELLARIEYVAPSDAHRVIANLRQLFELVIRFNAQVLSYYTAPYVGIPRRLSNITRELADTYGIAR